MTPEREEVEARLRAERPQPPQALLDSIAVRIAGGARGRRRPPLRIALAVAFSVAMVGATAALGAAGGVAGAAKDVASAVAKAATPPATQPPAASARRIGAPSAAPAAPAKVDICHATGSQTNPYVQINVSTAGAYNGHAGHSGDIIPAPSGGCPGRSVGMDQYEPGKGCGDPNHVHRDENECKGP